MLTSVTGYLPYVTAAHHLITPFDTTYPHFSALRRLHHRSGCLYTTLPFGYRSPPPSHTTHAGWHFFTHVTYHGCVWLRLVCSFTVAILRHLVLVPQFSRTTRLQHYNIFPLPRCGYTVAYRARAGFWFVVHSISFCGCGLPRVTHILVYRFGYLWF